MFGRLWRWLKRRRAGETQRERSIFPYFDGVSKRWADPFEIERLLEKHGGKDWMALLQGLSAGGGIALDKLSGPVRRSVVDNYHQAVLKVADLVRLAFHVVPLKSHDGKPVGLTDAECLRLMLSYLDFLAELEDEFRPLLLPPMEEPESPSAGLDGEPSSASPETVTGCDVNEVKTSPEASPEPSAGCGV